MSWLSLITGAFKAIAALFGFVEKQQEIKSGVTKQETADLAAVSKAQTREADAAAQSRDTEANLRKGSF